MSNKVEKSLSEIVRDVRVCYDEIHMNDADMVGDQDESELNTIIESKINEGIEFVYSNASNDLLEDDDNITVYEKSVSQESGDVRADKVVVINLDTAMEDMLRIVWVKMDSWLYAESEIMNHGEADCAYVADPYCGATYEKPAVVMSRSSLGRTLKIYKAKSTEEEGLNIAYVKKFNISEEGNNEFGSKLYPAIVYYICGLVATTFGETSRAREFMELAVSMIGLNKKG